ncbi:MAG: sugar phosphate isomerase/epimerase, partial [Candidatus Bathyarchaeota archaeon]|nr:sugar phosphate isomerase/epimerase [Candidatus Bathyarchaeota archaeon]
MRQRLDFLADVGFDAVEISPGSLNLIRNGVLHKQEASEFQDILSSYDLSYVAHAPMRTSLASPTILEISEQIVRSCIDFCSIIDARILTLHSGYLLPQDEISETDAVKVLTDSLRRCAEYAADSGVSIGLENGDMGSTHIIRRTDKLVKVASGTGMSNVGVTIDFGHLFVSATYYKFD